MTKEPAEDEASAAGNTRSSLIEHRLSIVQDARQRVADSDLEALYLQDSPLIDKPKRLHQSARGRSGVTTALRDCS